MHPTITFTADWSKTINFLDVKVSIAESIIETEGYTIYPGTKA